MTQTYDMPKCATRWRSQRGRRAFTLIEILVAIAIIAVVLGIVFAGFRGAISFTRESADRQAVAAMATAAANFEAAFGFLPPLVHDGEDERKILPALLAGLDPNNPLMDDGVGPIVRPDGNLLRVAVFSESFDADRRYLDATRADIDEGKANERYSNFTIAYFLVGALPESFDGREGPGYAQPQRDGSFGSPGERRYQFAPGSGPALTEGFLQTEGSQLQIQQRFFDPIEYREHGENVPANADSVDDINERIAVVDSNGRAFRYYRWLQPADASLETALGDSPANPGFIPTVLLDPLLVQLRRNDGLEYDTIRREQRGLIETSLNPVVLSARFAIVGAGNNGVFGTEAMEDILSALNRNPDEAAGLTSEARVRLRREAWQDNIVELGR